jgi:hypothetical protein
VSLFPFVSRNVLISFLVSSSHWLFKRKFCICIVFKVFIIINFYLYCIVVKKIQYDDI